MEENVAQEGEESVLKTVNLLRSHTFNNREGSRKRRRQEQAEVGRDPCHIPVPLSMSVPSIAEPPWCRWVQVGEQLVAMEAHLMASHRCVLTFYSAGLFTLCLIMVPYIVTGPGHICEFRRALKVLVLDHSLRLGYVTGGLFFTMRFLRDRALSEEDLDPPPSPRSRLVLRTLVVAAWRCLRIALNVGATQDVIDIITVGCG